MTFILVCLLVFAFLIIDHYFGSSGAFLFVICGLCFGVFLFGIFTGVVFQWMFTPFEQARPMMEHAYDLGDKLFNLHQTNDILLSRTQVESLGSGIVSVVYHGVNDLVLTALSIVLFIDHGIAFWIPVLITCFWIYRVPGPYIANQIYWMKQARYHEARENAQIAAFQAQNKKPEVVDQQLANYYYTQWLNSMCEKDSSFNRKDPNNKNLFMDKRYKEFHVFPGFDIMNAEWKAEQRTK